MSDGSSAPTALPDLRRHGPKSTFKSLRGPSLLLVEGNFATASALARLADAQGLALTVCWTIEELKRLPFTRFDGALIEEAIWLALQAPGWARQRRYFDGVPVVVLAEDGAEAAEGGPPTIVTRCARRDGPAVALAAAVAATKHLDDHHHLQDLFGAH